ncbi:MAG: hypothetical protein LBR45_04265 [Bacteroidales bacterium]|jgi:hypothetical protein|nr:hypothetical protein [Bacteroidales bacterium]
MGCGKNIIITAFLLLTNAWSIVLAQTVPCSIFDSTYCYMTIDNDKKTKKSPKYNLITVALLIENRSKDSIHITNFNKRVPHISETYVGEKMFYWEFFTLSNQKAEPNIVISPYAIVKTKDRRSKKQIKAEKEIDIIILPKSLFVSELYIKNRRFDFYEKGYYKLRLLYGENGKCIAEMVIQYK